MGVVSPLGTGIDAFHRALAAGKSGVSPIDFPWPTAYAPLRGGRVPDGDFAPFVPAEAKLGRASQLAVASARLALDHAGIAPSTHRPDRIGVVVGTAFGDATEFEDEWQRFRECGAAAPRAQGPLWMRLGNLAERISVAFGLEGPNHLITSTCAAGNHAIAWSAALLEAGTADVMLAVGADTIGFVDIPASPASCCRRPSAASRSTGTARGRSSPRERRYWCSRRCRARSDGAPLSWPRCSVTGPAAMPRARSRATSPIRAPCVSPSGARST